MRIEQQPGFVLHAREWRETSLLLEVFSRDHGRIGLLARGVRAARSRAPRALLQPLTPLVLSWSGRGELATLSSVESAGMPLACTGETLLCALYLNELLTRMLTRHDPHPNLFSNYVTTLARLAHGEPTAWTLRRFERDLLAYLGYGLQLETEDDNGTKLDPTGAYAWHFDSGPVRWRTHADGLKVSGSALLALARDVQPSPQDMATLRRLMRAVIAHHLDGPGLRAWNMFAGNHFSAGSDMP
ncbi:MAG TPA: DNA repair protein RecO [Rudaea sp.]|nr:DNA repair protein RecO [Rudaea sp.]